MNRFSAASLASNEANTVLDDSHFRYSVLMSVYCKENAGYFDESINSILRQTIKPSEFVVVCDGDLTNELNEVITRHSSNAPSLFKVVRLETNQGLGVALSEGIKHCSYDWVARMDSDDLCSPDRIEQQLTSLRQNPGLGLIGTNVLEFINSPDNVACRVILPETDSEIKKYYRRRCAFRHPSILMKKDEVLAAGSYSNKYHLFEDMDLFGRMIANGTRCHNVQAYLTQMRTSEDFYQRRGGLNYLKEMIRVRLMLLHIGVARPLDFAVSSIGQAIVCLMPNKLRSYFYRNYLRD